MNNANGRTQDLSGASPTHPTQDQLNSSKELREAIAAILREPEGEGALAVTSLELAEVMDKDKLDALVNLFAHHQAAIDREAVLDAQIKILAQVLVRNATGRKHIGLSRHGVVSTLAELQQQRKEIWEAKPKALQHPQSDKEQP